MSRLIALARIPLMAAVVLLTAGSLENRLAAAGRADRVPSLRVSSLGNHQGKFLSVFYVVGNRPVLSVEPDRLEVRRVRLLREYPVDADAVTVPSAILEKDGVQRSYNFVVLVISPRADFSWVNDDGSIPAGQLASENRERSAVRVIPRSEIDGFLLHDGQEPMTVPLE